MTTWASQVGLILWFLTFWCDAQKSSFFEGTPMVQQIRKIEPWGANWLAKSLRLASEGGIRGICAPRPAANYQRTSGNESDKSDKPIWREIYHANGPKAQRICGFNLFQYWLILFFFSLFSIPFYIVLYDSVDILYFPCFFIFPISYFSYTYIYIYIYAYMYIYINK